MRKLSLIVVILISTFLFSSLIYSQTPGLIYKPSSTTFGKSVLNPSGSGYVSANAGGFTTNVDYGTASELQMIPIPFLSLEPPNDLKTGAGFGHTDIVRNDADATQSQSVYLLVKNVGGTDYLIVRFRLGKSSTASKGYSILLDTDATYSGSGANPGFEYEVVLETGFRVAVYNHVNATVQSFDINEYSQRSIAASTVGGSNNVFYDFFVPLSALGPDDPVRFAATTITSAQSGISGTISDVDGVDDKKYANNVPAILKAMINAFPPTKLSTLTQGGSFPPAITTAPAITSKLTVASTSISGTSQENDGTTITVYKNGSQIGTTTVTNNTWTLAGVSGLALGDLITAKAQASGKSLSELSNEVEVTKVEFCYLPAPVVVTRTNGQQTMTGTWAPVSGSIEANTVKIRMYQQTAKNTFVQIGQKSGSMDTVVQTDGTWFFTLNLTQPQMNPAALYVTAELNGCMSRYSNLSQGNTGTLTLAPTITTDPILASTGPRNVSVTNNHSASATLILYINGNFVDSSASMIASGSSHTFSYSGFIEGERVTARAQSNGSNTIWLSNPSNTVIVTTTAAQTSAPVIEGQYIAGAGQAVSGTSTEEPGTTIYLYSNGGTLIGTTTVDAFGVWEVTGLTLTAGQVLTAKAQAIGKTLSELSNSVTVEASAPTPPTVTGTYQAGATSVSGTGGLGTVTIYVDDSPIGTTSGSGWTLSDIPSNQLFKGAVIKATNTVSGIESGYSNEVTVTGVNSFLITLPDDSPVPDQRAGVAFDVKFTAKDGADGTGSTVTTFTGTVVVASTSTITNGGGLTTDFSSGILSPHNMTLTTVGTDKTIEVVSTEDPTAFGTTTLDVIGIYYSIKSGVWNDASAWSYTGHDGDPADTFPVEDGTCYIGDNDTIWLNVNVVNNGIIYVENTGFLWTGMQEISGTGEFDLMAGGTLGLGAPGGLEQNIKVTGTHTFSTEGNLVYYYNGSQNVGNGAPITINDLTVTGGNIKTLVGDVTVDGLFNLENGTVAIGDNELTLSGPIDFSGGFIKSSYDPVTGISGSNLVITGSEPIVGDFRVSQSKYINSISTTRDLNLLGEMHILSDFIIDGSTFSIGNNNLHLHGDLVLLNGGMLEGGPDSYLLLKGSGDITIPEITLKQFAVQRDNTDIVTLNGPMTILEHLRMYNGILNSGTNLTLATGCSMWINNGELTGTPAFNSKHKIYYENNGGTIFTGSELLSSSNFPLITVRQASTVVLRNNIEPLQRMIIYPGSTVDVNGNNIALVGGGNIEQRDATLTSTNGGTVTITKNIAEVTGLDVAELGAVFTTRKKLGSTTIVRGFEAQEVVESEPGIKRYYDITPGQDLNRDLDFTFKYYDSELNGNDESTLKLYILKNEEEGWILLGDGGVVDITNNTITVTGLTSIAGRITAKGTPEVEGLIVEGNDRTKDNDKKKNNDRTKDDEKTRGNDQTKDNKNKLKTKGDVESRETENNTEPEVTQEIPSEAGLVQNYPNPFNPTTTIKFALPESDFVSVKVFDITGREIAELVSGHLNAGYHTVQFNGANLSSGIYFYKITTGSGFSQIMKMSLIK